MIKEKEIRQFNPKFTSWQHKKLSKTSESRYSIPYAKSWPNKADTLMRLVIFLACSLPNVFAHMLNYLLLTQSIWKAE